ncbi:MAG: hypothetical protein SH857_13695 [Chitinophagales bacterium]|nr:hypothetical protein [Chitinophagales bacterium]
MKTLTVKDDGSKEAAILLELLRSMKFVKETDIEDEISDDEKNIVEDRLAEYHKNTRGDKPLDKVVKTLSKKHGYKNHY